jgi:ribose/xylose/arabinose/galactoside ABC-type transport system permease subunit
VFQVKRNLTKLLGNRLAFLAVINVLVFVLMSWLSPYFLDFYSLLEMTRFGAVLGLLALGQTLVFVSGRGGIDLSVGSILSLAGVFFATLVVTLDVPVLLAAAVALAFGLLLGTVNGVLVTLVGMPPFIATLSTLYVYSSIALFWTDGKPISGFPEAFGFLGQGTILGVPNQVLLVLVPVALLLGYVWSSTVFGRSIFFIGINDTAARLSGISVRGTRIAVYAISGVLAAAGAIVTASWLLSARPDAGQGAELQAITVAVLGGAAITGGEGSLAGTMLALLLVTMFAFGLELAGVNATYQLAVLGLLLLVAVALNQVVLRRSSQAKG